MTEKEYYDLVIGFLVSNHNHNKASAIKIGAKEENRIKGLHTLGHEPDTAAYMIHRSWMNR